MNENPYASPAEVAEISREEEKFEIGLRRLTWGVTLILWGSVLMVLVFLIAVSERYGVLPPPFWVMYELQRLFEALFIAAAVGIPVTLLVGMVCCCFCPNRLMKRGWLHVLGSAAVLIGSMMIPTFLPFSYELANLLLAGLTTGILLWLFFPLRLAAALESTAGKRLAWCVIIVFSLLMAGWVAYINLYSWYDIWMEMWWEFMAVGCVGIHAALLVTLRRRIRRILAERL